MSAKIRIAVDAMSGDLGPRVAMAAAHKFVSIYDDVDLFVVGDEHQLRVLSTKYSTPSFNKYQSRITIIHASDVVGMNESPLSSLRHKQKSSMWIALDLVKKDTTDACVSAGNTGVLLAMGKYLLKTFPGVERPAICKLVPSEKNTTYLLDLGANVDCSASMLHQFALMGSVLSSSVHNPRPQIGLLNIGVEPTKGTDILQSAQSLLQCDTRLNYVGFVEADAIFSGTLDVIVCDGFHGNIALKSSEGMARFIAGRISKTFNKNFLAKVLGLIFWRLLKRWREEFDPSMYNGASFLGLQKTVVKSHGGADKKAFLQALIVAREQVIQQVPERIQKQLAMNLVV